MSAMALILSCEHASKRVPLAYRKHFRGREKLLDSHRGWDPGALELARHLARELDAPLFRGVVTRLLVDLNRPLDGRTLFSEYARRLTDAERERLIERYWRPYHDAVGLAVRRKLARGETALHLGVHSFTPVLRGKRRTTDVGILFDPARAAEARFAGRLRAALREELSGLRIDWNKPYSGTTDAITTSLRAELPRRSYLGIELEVSQRFPRGERDRWRALRTGIARALRAALAD